MDFKLIRPKINKFASEDLVDITQVESEEDRAFLRATAAHGFDKKRIELALKVAHYYE